MLETSIAGSLPKPFWLAKPGVLWAPWTQDDAALAAAKRDATLLWLKEQEDAGIDIVTDGEQSRQHFVHGFLAEIDGIDFTRRVKMGIRDNRYEAECPTVVAPLRRKSPVHRTEAMLARAHTTRTLKFTLPGPMTIIDTIANEHYPDRVAMAMRFAELLNEEAKELATIGVDVIQFDEPAFNVYGAAVKEWGIEALHRAAAGLSCKTAVHICYGYGIKANIDWKHSLGSEWRQYETIFPALAQSRIDQVSLECVNSRVPLELLRLLGEKSVSLGAIDVATDRIETAGEVAATLRRALDYVPAARLEASTNCGMAPMDRAVAIGKLEALAQGAALLRRELGHTEED
jgi:5-methyltetrahydropteroyltriglutamate--homocysteine methyltransferase